MATPVTLPQLGESVTEGTVTRWLKQPGDTVAVDEPLLEVSTDKVDTEIPSPVGGVLLAITVGEDETVPVGAELGVIGEPGEAPAGGGTDGAAPPAAAPEQPPQASSQQPAQVEPPSEEPPAAAAPEPAAASAAPAAAVSAASGQPVTLPQLGESVTEGTVVRWLKQVGDSVAVDEPLLEVSTDKVDTEIPSPAAGVLLEIKVAEDETVEVGAVLALVGEQVAAPAAAAPAPAAAPEPPAPPVAPTPATQAAPPAAAPPPPPTPPAPVPGPAAAPAAAPAPPRPAPAGDGPSPYVTPLVRKLAAEHGVDLAAITGTGVGGRVRKQDVLAAAEAARQAAAAAPAPAPTPAAAPAAGAAPAAAAASPLRGTTTKMSRLRQVIADRMVESLHVSAQLTTVVEVDMTAVARLRAQAKGAFEAREGVKLSFLPFLAKAALEALKTHPMLNASIDVENKQVTYYDVEHLGVAVDTERGLLVPVIKEAGDLNIAGLARKIADLAERTRTNKITPDELSGGTFTLTNTGSRGALFDTPIINQPQTGILGTGAIVKRPVVVSDSLGSDTIAVRQMMFLALTYDHRIVDGADAARFLSAVKARLEEGAFDGDLGL
jgi:2-oxoglutarate dehydrogenase E2 component (dihydrolipoamide succinyltransferase)